MSKWIGIGVRGQFCDGTHYSHAIAFFDAAMYFVGRRLARTPTTSADTTYFAWHWDRDDRCDQLITVRSAAFHRGKRFAEAKGQPYLVSAFTRAL